MLELAILGLLKDQDLHGYELKRRLTEELGAFSSVSFGSLYPALNRLEAAGAVKAVTARPATPTLAPPVPATGSLGAELAAFRAKRAAVADAPARGGRSKKVYGITDHGEHLFEELLATDAGAPEDERDFHLRLAFARHLPPEARLGLLERRRAALVERLARSRSTRRVARSGDRYTEALLERGAAATESDISWLDRLIARERAAAVTSPESAITHPSPTHNTGTSPSTPEAEEQS